MMLHCNHVRKIRNMQGLVVAEVTVEIGLFRFCHRSREGHCDRVP
jgi:hypothetical protein